MSAGITGVLLAAGAGRRFGSNKLLHSLDNGLPMVVASARQLKAALPHTIAVVADPDGEVAGLLREEGLGIVVNSRAAGGMGTSIARGVAASTVAQGWVIALADMPFIPATVIHQVVEGLAGGGSVVAPVYRERRGHPVGFSARHAGALMRLAGDEGARGIIRDNRGSLVLIEVDEPGVVTDIDTPGSDHTGVPRAAGP